MQGIQNTVDGTLANVLMCKQKHAADGVQCESLHMKGFYLFHLKPVAANALI